MKTPFLPLMTALLLAIGWPQSVLADGTQTAAAVRDDAPKAPGDILFEVRRNGEPVGEHQVWFHGSGDDLRVDVRFQISIPILLIARYDYLYESTSRWQDGAMTSLTATTDDDGDVSTVTATYGEGKTQIIGPAGEVVGDGSLYPTNHWNTAVLGSNRVLNTITGEIDDVVISEIDRETVQTEQGAITATRYAYSGDLRTEVLYDADGRWVGMTFEAEDGSTIDYRCLRCQNGPVVTAVQ